MHWLTHVFSDPDEEMLFRRNTLAANKTLILACGGMGLSCFVVLWFAAARNGPHVTHALWTPWSIGVLTVILMYLLAPESDRMEICASHFSSSWHYLVAASAYFASFGQALLYGLEPLTNFEYAVWCVAGLLQLLYPFLLAYPPRSKMKVYFVNFIGYSALALGGYFGDRPRAICIGGLLLGAALTLGNALERVKRLAFLLVLRDKAMVGVHVAKEQSEITPRWQAIDFCFSTLGQAIDDVAEEYVCPITAELPIDPVTAEDGRCYERCAIEAWFVRQPQAMVKSPVTNEPMGKRLFPAVQLRNTLKRLVESGAISGSKADAWKAAMADEAKMAAIRVKAEGGDAMAMSELGYWYRDGRHGLKKDSTQSFMWLKRAADLKDVHALTGCGAAYLTGQGVEQSISRGLITMGAAATLGSEHACGILGLASADGIFGLDKNPQEATRWYREMQNCTCRNTTEDHREMAAAWLREHP